MSSEGLAYSILSLASSSEASTCRRSPRFREWALNSENSPPAASLRRHCWRWLRRSSTASGRLGIHISRQSPAPEERNVYRLALLYSLAPSGAACGHAHMPLLTELGSIIHCVTINIALLRSGRKRHMPYES